MSDEIIKVIAGCLTEEHRQGHVRAADKATEIMEELHAAGYTIAPLPENLTEEQINAALRRDELVSPYVRDGEMTLGDAWRETYRAALGIPPKEAE